MAFPLVLSHLTSGNPDGPDNDPSPGLGVGLGFQIDSDAGALQEAGAITVQTVDASSGDESYGMTFSLMKNGDSPTSILSLDNDLDDAGNTHMQLYYDQTNWALSLIHI